MPTYKSQAFHDNFKSSCCIFSALIYLLKLSILTPAQNINIKIVAQKLRRRKLFSSLVKNSKRVTLTYINIIIFNVTLSKN